MIHPCIALVMIHPCIKTTLTIYTITAPCGLSCGQYGQNGLERSQAASPHRQGGNPSGSILLPSGDATSVLNRTVGKAVCIRQVKSGAAFGGEGMRSCTDPDGAPAKAIPSHLDPSDSANHQNPLGGVDRLSVSSCSRSGLLDGLSVRQSIPTNST